MIARNTCRVARGSSITGLRGTMRGYWQISLAGVFRGSWGGGGGDMEVDLGPLGGGNGCGVQCEVNSA